MTPFFAVLWSLNRSSGRVGRILPGEPLGEIDSEAVSVCRQPLSGAFRARTSDSARSAKTASN